MIQSESRPGFATTVPRSEGYDTMPAFAALALLTCLLLCPCQQLALDGSESHTGSSARAAASAAASASGASSSHRQRRQREDSDDDGDGVSSPATKRIRRKHFSHDAIATLQQYGVHAGCRGWWWW